MPARPRNLPPIAGATPDPVELQAYAEQTKAVLDPLVRALLTAKPADPAAWCAQYFQDLAGGSAEERAGEAAPPVAVHASASTAALLAPREAPLGAVADEELSKPYDVVVIGAGPAGVAAAVQASFFGRRALLIDDPNGAGANFKKAVLGELSVHFGLTFSVEFGADAHELDLGFGAPTGLYSKALRDSAKSIDVNARRAAGASSAEVWAEVGLNVERLATNNAETQYKLLEEMRVDHLRGRATVQGAESVLAALTDG